MQISQETIVLTEKLLNWLKTIDQDTAQGLITGELTLCVTPSKEKVEVLQQGTKTQGLTQKNNKCITTPAKKIEVEIEITIEDQAQPQGTVEEMDQTKQLRQMTTREEAKAYIEGLGLTVAALKAWAKVLNIYIKSNDRKATVIDKIIEGVVGSQLRSKALGGQESM
ncbi:MAG: hypothetical protein ACRCW2_15195 [Cellulosilyticaceae bacterium]